MQDMEETWGLIPGSGRSPGEGNGNPFQHSSLENPMDRGAWWVTSHRVTKSRRGLKQFGILTLKAPPSGALGQVQCLFSLYHISSQCSLVAQSPPANEGDLGSIPVLGRSSKGGDSNLLQYSCLGNPMCRGDWRAIVHKLDMT